MNYREIFEKAYKGKKVLLTGHTGFKGSWLLTWLHDLGADVYGYSLAPENDNDLYQLIKGDTYCTSTIADIRNLAAFTEVVNNCQPDFIFHLAAQPIVRTSYVDPLYTFDVNCMGTAHVLDAVRKLEKPCSVIIITTDKVYENLEIDYPYKEEDKLGGYDPYSASKAAAEIVVSSYRSSFFHPGKYDQHKKDIASTRAGNVIGGGDRSKDRIIPDIVRAIETNEMLTMRNPNAVRPWQHVLEPLSGYLLLGAKMAAEPGRWSSSWNLGPAMNDSLTVKEVVEEAIAIWGQGRYQVLTTADQPHEAGLLKLDNTKATTQLGWIPKMNSKEAIRKTIEWYKNVTPATAAEYTKAQIHWYENAS